MRVKLYIFASSSKASISTGKPAISTTITNLTSLFFTISSTSSGEILRDFESISAVIICAPRILGEDNVAKNVKSGTITLSPGLKPWANNAQIMAEVPLFTTETLESK